MFNLTEVLGQVPPPPPPPNSGSNNGHGLGGNQGEPSAPIGGGLEIMILLGGVYLMRKKYKHKQFIRDH